MAGHTGLAHERLSAALVEDILAGTLAPGARLPPHRDLAAALSLSVGTVTRAYATVQRRGLAKAEHGRGMFVLAVPNHAPDRIDFSVNLPPPMVSARMMSDMMQAVAATLNQAEFSTYTPPAGPPEHRHALAWHLQAERGLMVEAGQVLITSGAQHALFVALCAAPPGPVAVEAFTYPLALSTIRQLGRSVVPVAMDTEGVMPDALAAAMGGSDAPRVLYLVPTMQNPTGSTMGEARRAAIVALARRHDLIIIEDDIYGGLVPQAGPALAALAPERVLYVSGFSKCFAPGLRLGHLACPPALVDRCCDWLKATSSMAGPLACALLRHILADRLAEGIAQSIRGETARRNRTARQVLGDAVATTGQDSLHLWLPMPVQQARDVQRRAAARNVLLAPPAAFMAAENNAESGIRLCLGNVAQADLIPGLEVVASLARGETRARLDEGAII